MRQSKKALLFSLVLLLSCNSGSSIEGGNYGNTESNNKRESDTQAEPLDSTGENGNNTELVALGFPVLGMTAKGTTFCKEALGTASSIETKLSEESLELKRVAVRVDCYKQSGPFGSGACNQTEFDQKINSESLGTTVFTRATKKQLDQMKENGTKAPAYAIMATKAQTHKGLQYEFSSPLPIFPWPAAKARYEPIDGIEQEFSAEVTGEKNVSVKMTVKMIDSTSTTATLQFQLTINGSEERSLYDKFPIPRMAVYTINTETKDVRTIVSTDWFYDKECPVNGQASLTYKLCKKTKNNKTENFPCN